MIYSLWWVYYMVNWLLAYRWLSCFTDEVKQFVWGTHCNSQLDFIFDHIFLPIPSFSLHCHLQCPFSSFLQTPANMPRLVEQWGSPVRKRNVWGEWQDLEVCFTENIQEQKWNALTGCPFDNIDGELKGRYAGKDWIRVLLAGELRQHKAIFIELLICTTQEMPFLCLVS